jgi:hypothetical protein
MQVLRADKSGEMELSGTSLELLELVKGLRSSRGTRRLGASGNPSPYSRALSSIESRRTSGKVAILLPSDGETLEIQGGLEELELLASNIEDFAADGDRSAHLHVEYFPGHDYLSERSEPLVIALAG